MNQQVDIKLTLWADATLSKEQIKGKFEDLITTLHSKAHERRLIPEINIVDIKEEAEIYDVEASFIIKEAFDHVKSYHPNINIIIFNREGKWLCMDDDFDAPEFSQQIDTNLLNQAVNAAQNTFGLPYVYQENYKLKVMDTSKEDILIGEFMGFTYDEGIGYYDNLMLMPQIVYDNEGGNCFDSLLFNSSWDWLMPVLEKIRRVLQKGLLEFYNDWYDVFKEKLITYDLKQIHTVVVEFIVWYNNQNESHEVLS